MKECCETGGPKKRRYWHWVVLGGVGIILGASYLMRPRYFCFPGAPKTSIDMIEILHSLDEYAINNNGAYPSTLQPLVTPDTNGNAYLEGYNGKIPKDPWKHEYHYEVPTSAYPRPHIWSYGADGKRGGSSDDADIDSDRLSEDP